MKVRDIMTQNPICCTMDMRLSDVARLMVTHDCGAIPVVRTHDGGEPIGIITDRDIVCRTIARGRNPMALRVRDAMTDLVLTTTPQTAINECCSLMEGNKIRRIVVVDEAGRVCGIVSQADIAAHSADERTADLVRGVSEPIHLASMMG